MSEKPVQSPLMDRVESIEKRLRHVEWMLIALVAMSAPELLKYLVG